MSRPALHALIPYLLGILVGGFSSIPIFWIWLTALSCLVGSLALRNVRKRNFSIRPLPPITYRYILLQLAIFACGALYSEIRLTSPIPEDFYNQEICFSGKTLYQPERGESWDACFVEGEIRLLESPDHVVSAKLLIYFREPVPLHYGDHLELRGALRRPNGERNPGGFDYRFYLARRQAFGILYPERGLEVAVAGQSGFLLLCWTESLRRRVEEVIDSAYKKHPEHVEILKGMLLGKRGGIEESTIAAFRNSGSLHILAVSGLHVGLIAGVFFLCFSHLPAKTTCVLTILAVILYASIVGFRPSVFRASTMVILFLFGLIIDRDVDRFNLLAVAALILLLINPAQLWDIGFQLSFAAVASILYFMPKWESFIRDILPNWIDQPRERENVSRFRHTVGKGIRWLLLGFGVTLAAQLGTILFIAGAFYRLYPLGLIAGPFVVGLATPIVSLALISVILGAVWLPLAIPLVYANHLIILVLLNIIEFFGSQEWSVVKTAPPTFGWVIVFFAGCVAIVYWRWVWLERKKAVLIGLAVVAIWVWDAAWREDGRLLEVTFLDVRQGDAAFVRFPDGKTMLIDGGRNLQFAYQGNYEIEPKDDKELKFLGFDTGERILSPFLSYKGIGKLDLLLLSHPDNDHGGGLYYILHEYGVKRVLGVPHLDLPPITHRVLHQLIDEKGIPHELGYAGEIELTSTATLELLHPFDEGSTNLIDRDINDDSLVLKLSYGEVDILFTGDIERRAEKRLVESGADLGAEILKVPHHGSKTSSSPEFLSLVRPQYGIFSLSARNPYNFPPRQILRRYRNFGCKVLRTDELGAIQLKTDGRRCWITHHANFN